MYWLMCILELFVLWQNCGTLTLFPPLPEELWKNRFQTNKKHKHTSHTGLEPKNQSKQTKCTNWPLQTCLQAWTNSSMHTDTEKQYLILSNGYSVCCTMCVLCLHSLSLWLPWDIRQGQVNSLTAVLPHVTFALMLSQTSMWWIAINANIKPYLMTVQVQ